MSEAAPSDRRPPLVRLFAQWTALLARESPPGVHPLLRLEHGAALVQAGPRAEVVARVLPALLSIAAPLLYVGAGARGVGGVRPKLRVSLSLPGAGLLVQLRYFGDAPDDAAWRAALAPLAAHVQALPPLARQRARTGEVCLRALWAEGVRRWPLVRVLAGRREVALPMFSVLRALSQDDPGEPIADTRSLAGCLGEEAVPAAHGRPAVLVLRRRGEPAALRVESLLGHGTERVLPAGALLLGVPWLLGVVARDEASPVLVVDPLALPDPQRQHAA